MVSKELKKKIDRAILLLQSVQHGYDGQIEVAYSGGKDSDVILQLAKEAGINYRAIYRNTTIDPPGTIAHVKRMGVEIRRPKENFFQLVARKGFPNRFSRFCCEILKEYKVLDKCIMGVRKSESSKRNNRYNEPTECRFYGSKTEKNHVEAIYPILDWTDDDVLNFILDRGIKVAPIYYNWGGGIHSRICLADSDVCVVHLLRNASVFSTSKKCRKWYDVICGLERNSGTRILKQRFVSVMQTCMNGLLAICFIREKRIGKRQMIHFLKNRTIKIFLNSSLESILLFN